MKPRDIRRIGRASAPLLPHVTSGHRTGSSKPAQPAQASQPSRTRHTFKTSSTRPTPRQEERLDEVTREASERCR